MKTNKIICLFIILKIFTACEPSYLLKEQESQLSSFKVKTYPAPDQLVEISGLQLLDDRFIGFNDSGGEPEVYILSATDSVQIEKIVRLNNAKNIDWESIAISDSLIFVGDFGNNRGERNDLTIYYFPINKITDDASQIVESKSFSFFYPEQMEFENHAYNHDFDMEAMFYLDEKLHLFTKEWKSEKTHHYTLDFVKGKQPGWLVEEYDTNFLVTGADIVELNNKYSRLGLVGYTRDGDVSMLLTDVKRKDNKWLGNPKMLINLGKASQVGQVEGIAFKSANKVCYSAEKITMDDRTIDQNITCFTLK